MHTDIVPIGSDTLPSVIARSHSADVASREERDIQKRDFVFTLSLFVVSRFLPK